MKLITIADGTQAAPGCLFGEQVVNFVRAAQTIPSAAAIPNSLAQILNAMWKSRAFFPARKIF